MKYADWSFPSGSQWLHLGQSSGVVPGFEMWCVYDYIHIYAVLVVYLFCSGYIFNLSFIFSFTLHVKHIDILTSSGNTNDLTSIFFSVL